MGSAAEHLSERTAGAFGTSGIGQWAQLRDLEPGKISVPGAGKKDFEALRAGVGSAKCLRDFGAAFLLFPYQGRAPESADPGK